MSQKSKGEGKPKLQKMLSQLKLENQSTMDIKRNKKAIQYIQYLERLKSKFLNKQISQQNISDMPFHKSETNWSQKVFKEKKLFAKAKQQKLEGN